MYPGINLIMFCVSFFFLFHTLRVSFPLPEAETEMQKQNKTNLQA